MQDFATGVLPSSEPYKYTGRRLCCDAIQSYGCRATTRIRVSNNGRDWAFRLRWYVTSCLSQDMGFYGTVLYT